jgi:choline-glycine betaine transporter
MGGFGCRGLNVSVRGSKGTHPGRVLGTRPSGYSSSVFYITVAISAVFVLAGVFFTEPFGAALATVVGYITDYLGWLYMLMTSFFLAFAAWLAMSRYGKIRLGQSDDKPE